MNKPLTLQFDVSMECASEEFMGVLMATDREIHMYGRYGKVTRYVTVYVGGQEHQHVVKLEDEIIAR